MSGHKRTVVHISEEEYERLHQAEMRQRFQRAERKSNAPTTENATRQLETELRQVTQRQNQFLRHIARLDENLQAIELETSRVLINQQAQVLEQLKTQNQQISVDASLQIQEASRLIYQDVEEIRRDSQSRLEALESALSSQQVSRRQQFEYAAQWLDSAETIASFIASEYDHDHFTPGELARADLLLQQAYENLQNNFPEAATSQAQLAYRDFSQLRLTLEAKMHDWFESANLARDKAGQIRQLFEDCRTLPALDLEGKPLPVYLNLEYWSQGEFTRLEAELDQIENLISADWRISPLPKLRQIVEQTLPSLQNRIDQMIYTARLAALNSQLRINIADLVIQALEVQGFKLTSSAYREQDYLHDYQANLTSLDGSQVVVEVSPTLSGQGENELHIHSLDQAQRTPYELRRRSLEINRSLQAFGLKTSPLEEIPQRSPGPKPAIPAQYLRKNQIRSISLSGNHE